MLYKLTFLLMDKLTIGILLTDHVLDDLKPKHGDQDDFYSKIFGEADTNIKLKIYDVTLNNYPADINECDEGCSVLAVSTFTYPARTMG